MFMNLLARLFPSGRSDTTEGSRGANHGAQDKKMAPERLADPMDALAMELGRARRYEHALSIVVVHPHTVHERPAEDPASADGAALIENGRSSATPVASHDLEDAGGPEAVALARRLGLPPEEALACLTAAGLREVLRTSDVVCYDAVDEHFVLGLMEADAPPAHRAVMRIRALFRERLEVDLRAGIAQFPVDGLTLEDLVQTARARSDGNARDTFEEQSRAPGARRYRVPSDRATPRARRRSAEPAPADSRMAGGE